MHDDCVWLCVRNGAGADPKRARVFAKARQERACKTLSLNAQDHHDVGAFERFLEPVEHPHAERVDCGRKQCPRADDSDLTPKQLQQMRVGPCDARVGDVADDGDDQIVERSLLAPDGERVEQCLRRMRVHPVAGVDDAAADLGGDIARSARCIVSDDDHIRMHRLECPTRVLQGLALLHAGRGHAHVDDVGAEPLARELE